MLKKCVPQDFLIVLLTWKSPSAAYFCARPVEPVQTQDSSTCSPGHSHARHRTADVSPASPPPPPPLCCSCHERPCDLARSSSSATTPRSCPCPSSPPPPSVRVRRSPATQRCWSSSSSPSWWDYSCHYTRHNHPKPPEHPWPASCCY